MESNTYRLPPQVRPRHYDVTLDARIDRSDYHGQVAIQLDIATPVRAIELHAQDLTLDGVRLVTADTVYPGQVVLDPDQQIARIQFAQPVPASAARLEIGFRGRVSHGLEGLYLAQAGPDRLLSTHCEPTGARRIIPCFDEPTFKASFAWQIHTAADATALGNGPLVSVAAGPDGTGKTWTFAPTRPMPTYLIGLVIGPVASTPEERVNGVPLRVWAVAGKQGLGTFAQAYTVRLLPWYEAYFGVPYHWAKLDQVAVPGFAGGAMENVALVIFRQARLLMNPATAPWAEEKRIAAVVAHEFAHMWFGDLVTMAWWDDLWLKEAFATWLAYHALAALTPEYAIWDDFQDSKEGALQVDGLVHTHPVSSRVGSPAEAREMFDAITYQKGAAMLRMLHAFLGDGPFRAGLQHYLHAYAEGNAVRGDLWRALERASGQPVGTLMETWVSRPGYPLIAVRWDPDAGQLHLAQRRFFNGTPPPDEEAEPWPVPIAIRYADAAGVHETRCLLAARDLALPLAVRGDIHWCTANTGEVGFYRQAPDPALLRGLLAHLDDLAPVEQVALLNDQWALVQAGDQAIATFLEVLVAGARSGQYQVLTAVVTLLHTLQTLLEEAGDGAALQGFRTWAGTLFQAHLATLGFAPVPGEARNASQARVAVVDAMTTLAQDPAALAQARVWADREAADPAAVDRDLAPVYVAAAAQFGDAALFDRYVARYRARLAAGAPPQETERYLAALLAFRDPALTLRLLALLDGDVLPLEGAGWLLPRLFTRPQRRPAAWEYLKSHWAGLATRVRSWIPAVVASTGDLPPALRGDLVAFFDAHLRGEAQQRYAQALERLDQRAALHGRIDADLLAWFRLRTGDHLGA